MPSLIANHRKHVVETKLAKVYSVMNQAISMSVAENGPAADWMLDCGSTASTSCSSDDVEKWFKNYIGKYLKTIKTESDDLNLYVVDKNALENSKSGINAFAFSFKPILPTGQDADKNKYAVKSTFEPYVWAWDGTMNGLLHSTYQYECGEAHNSYCTKQIQMNGWKIPKDYPIKF